MVSPNYVPCNGCIRCCQNDAVRILDHEDPSQWQTEPHPYFTGSLMLAHKPNGDCVYLNETGCSIHGRAPQQCATMDCRTIARGLTYTQAIHTHLFKVWWKGNQLLPPSQRRK